MQQREYIREYNDKYRPKFNNEFFVRHDEDLIEALRKIIYSCERTGPFTIKVIGWEVIDGYDDINHILWQYEESIINKNKSKKSVAKISKRKVSNKRSRKSKDNSFAYINLRDTDFKLIKVTYYIDIVEKKNGFVSDTITVYIAIPTIVNGMYYRISGNTYIAKNQIVDASTYNNSASKNSKKQSVTFKSFFMATRIYRYQSTLKTIDDIELPCVYFVINAFKKSLLLLKYFLSKFGLFGAQKFLKLQDIFVIRNVDLPKIDRNINYIFPTSNKEVFIVCPKMIYDNIQIAQSFVYTLCDIIKGTKHFRYSDMFNDKIYNESVGINFTSKDQSIIYSKGKSILSSLESIYDKITMDDLHLPEEDKSDVFRILRWLMYEFNSLRQKDNLDITTKKVRNAEYIVTYYATKLFLGICRVSDRGDKADLNSLKKALQISPMFLINAISKCQLVSYKNSVNDLDSILALQYTYKGIAGIGEKSNAISSAYRSVHPSHLGKVDIDSSSNSDPGVSGTLCPLAKLYDHHFSEYEEPSEWHGKVSMVIDQYRASKSKISLYKLLDQVKTNTIVEDNSVSISDEAISIAYDLLTHIKIINNLIPQMESEYDNDRDCFVSNCSISSVGSDYIEITSI